MLGVSKEKATARMKLIYFLKQFIVLAKITYGLPVYSASEADLYVIQCFLTSCFKRQYTSKLLDIWQLLEESDRKLF